MGVPGKPVDPAARPTRVRWHIVGLLMAHAALCHFNRISISVAGAEQIIPHEGVSATRMGLVYSGFLLCYTLAMLPGAALRVVGRRTRLAHHQLVWPQCRAGRAAAGRKS